MSSSNDETMSVGEQWRQVEGRWRQLDSGVPLVESSDNEAREGAARGLLAQVMRVSARVASSDVFSPNETKEDVSTPSLRLVFVDYVCARLARDHLHRAETRAATLALAQANFKRFLARAEQLALVHENDLPALRALDSDHDNDEGRKGRGAPIRRGAPSRDELIERAQRERANRERLQVLSKRLAEAQRRKALHSLQKSDNGDVDGKSGGDGDGDDDEDWDYLLDDDDQDLLRELTLLEIEDAARDSIQQLKSLEDELLMARMHAEHLKREAEGRGPSEPSEEEKARSNRPMHAVHIGPDGSVRNVMGQVPSDSPVSNVLEAVNRRRQIAQQVFRPGWRQPTMSLEELARQEVREAEEREARSAVTEAATAEHEERLENDDNGDYYDQTEVYKKREWDEFTDDNPRGHGNRLNHG